MKPNPRAQRAAAITLSKGKMYEYGVSDEHHLELPKVLKLDDQLPFALGTIGDYAAEVVSAALADQSGIGNSAEDVLFASHVLHAYDEARLNVERSADLRILAAAGYYLGSVPGGSHVQLKRYKEVTNQNEDALRAAVCDALDRPWIEGAWNTNQAQAARTLVGLNEYFRSGEFGVLGAAVKALRDWAYREGSDRELLMADLLGSIALARVRNSCWKLLPVYSGLSREEWAPYLQRHSSTKEMWPSQMMLGDAGLYRGLSGVIQMPTSAGKTRATQLIIRSAFLSGRTKLAVIIAPFRALCQEIAADLRRAFRDDGYSVNQLSDALQMDFHGELEALLEDDLVLVPKVIVLTPEKLLYALRQEPNLVQDLGLVIYDEGHQFDTGARGVTYELLLTSIRRLLGSQAQSVLISAVIENAHEISKWLISDESRVVRDAWSQTRRLVAFASFPRGKEGQLQFNQDKEESQEFYVPRVISKQTLDRRGRERTLKSFPDQSSSSVALYLGLRLVANGGVAIYVGTKLSASKVVRDAVDAFDRGLSLPKPSSMCDPAELAGLTKLFADNFGNDSYLVKAASLGIFAHHGNTPHGLRLALEYAMRGDKIRLIVCTSTLAQGVNLPLRYLLVTSAMQGREAIKPRDFHNLMGRAGRAGIHGEGTVIFTDHRLFDERSSERSRWESAIDLLRPGSAKPTGSTLLSLLDPLKNGYKNRQLVSPTIVELLDEIISGDRSAFAWIEHLDSRLLREGFSSSDLHMQIQLKRETIEAIESFLMTYRGTTSSSEFVAGARKLAQETFAYSIAGDEEKILLQETFARIAQRIDAEVPDATKQARFGRSLLGLDELLAIDEWVFENVDELLFVASPELLFRALQPLLLSLNKDKVLQDVAESGAFHKLVEGWLGGSSFGSILADLTAADVSYRYGSKRRKLSIEMVVELCEQKLGFELSLFLAAIKESYGSVAASDENGESFGRHIDLLQKRLKYGLPTKESVACFELGFAERMVAQRVALTAIDGGMRKISDMRLIVKQKAEIIREALKDYPLFFLDALEEAIR